MMSPPPFPSPSPSGFLTDDLSTHHDQSGGGKYLGVCRLPGTERKV